jgi:CRP/FNR family transcriptional regulator, polysaccharide utilization system transcription regulator
MQFFATKLKESERNMRNLAHMPVRDRIAQALLTLEEKFGTTTNGFINIIISRQDLASFAGTSYETLFRVLNELISEKIIEIYEKRFRIINKRLLMPDPK